jgi:phage baseplate assembly protein W
MSYSPFSINPSDLNRNQAIGVAFPLLVEGNFTQTFLVKDQVKANLINVLLTEKGERVNQPEFGIGLKTLLFENNINVASLEPEIERQIDLYVPDIELYDISLSFDPDEHTATVKLTYAVLGENELDAIEINVDKSQNVAFDYKLSVGGF